MTEPLIDKDLLTRITAAAKLQMDTEKKIEETKEQEKALNRQLAEISGGFINTGGKQILQEGLIPNLMMEADTKQIILTDGLRVSVDDELKPPSMAADAPNRQKVLDWADRTGHSDVIKDFIAIPFDKGDKRLKTIVWMLERLKLPHERYRSIHPQTLKSLFNEIMEDAEQSKHLPIEELGILMYKHSDVGYPKPKAAKKEK